jgi:hypothetical protein
MAWRLELKMQAELNHARPDRGRGDLAEGRTGKRRCNRILGAYPFVG